MHAQLALNSGGRSIHIDACGQQGDWDQEEIAIPFGDGGNLVSVSAGGDISVSDHEEDSDEFSRRFKSSFDNWSSFGLDLEKQIQDSVAAATENIKWVSMGALGASEKARMKVEKAMRKLDDKGIWIDHKGIHVDQPGKGGRKVSVNNKGIHVGDNGKVVGFTYPGEVKKDEKTAAQPAMKNACSCLRCCRIKRLPWKKLKNCFPHWKNKEKPP